MVIVVGRREVLSLRGIVKPEVSMGDSQSMISYKCAGAMVTEFLQTIAEEVKKNYVEPLTMSSVSRM